MFLKQIKNPIKLNFFKKLFLLTFGIVFFTILIGFLLNFLFFNKFYVYRTKQNILSIRNEIIHDLDENRNFSTLRNNIDDIYGIKADLRSFKNTSHSHTKRSKMMRNYFNTFKSLKENESFFTTRESDHTPGVMFLRYYERLPKDRLLILRTSLSVLSSRSNDMIYFNFFVAIVSVIFSSFFTFLFSRKVTKNITHLKLSAQKIAQLEHPKDIIINSNDEFQDLSQNLDTMSQNLLYSINNLNLFVSNASHELKTPISILCLYSQALARNQVKDEDKKKYYKVLLNKSLEMRTLTESLLTLSKINSIDYKILKNQFDLEKIIKESIENYDYLEFEKNITLNLNLKSYISEVDIDLFKIAINNLVQNLFKYSPEDSTGKIILEDDKIIFENPLLNSISQEKEKLFQPFSRGDNATEDSIEGSGLGLSIVKRILELHNFNYSLNLESNKFIFIIYLK